MSYLTQHLLKRTSGFYFRLVVPKRLRLALGKSEIRHPLRTSSEFNAVQLLIFRKEVSHPSIQALVMPKERSDEVRQFLDAAQRAQSQPFHLVLGLDEPTADTPLDMRPDLFVRVELRRIRW